MLGHEATHPHAIFGPDVDVPLISSELSEFPLDHLRIYHPTRNQDVSAWGDRGFSSHR